MEINERDRKDGSYCFNCMFWCGGDAPMEPDGTAAKGPCGFSLATDPLKITTSNGWCCLWMARKDETYMNKTEGAAPGGLPECPYQIGKLAYMVVIGETVAIGVGDRQLEEKTVQMPHVIAANVDALMTDGQEWIPCRRDKYGKIEPLVGACKAVFGAAYASAEDAEKVVDTLIRNYQKSQHHFFEVDR